MLTKSELKAWTDALRSGKYVQGQEKLKSVDKDGFCSHCCLGVLCEINGLEQFVDTNCVEFIDEQGRSSTYLPRSLAHKFGCDEGLFDNLSMPWLNGFPSIAFANDNDMSFAEIADHLDKYYPAVED